MTMSTPSEKLAAAKLKPRAFVDVDILLDSGISDARDALIAELQSAVEADALDSRLTGENPAIDKLRAAIEALLDEAADSFVTIRVTALSGDVWSDIESRSPARMDSPGDKRFGYNTQTAARKALPLSAGWLVDGEVVPLAVVEADLTTQTDAVDEWADLFTQISGSDAATLESAVWELNVANPQVAINEIKKALATRPA